MAALPSGLIGLAQESQEYLLKRPIEILTCLAASGEWQLQHDCIDQVLSENILLDANLASRVLIDKLSAAVQETGSGKGRLLERALALGCSQIPGWRVRDINFKTSNEELDLVVANNSAKSPWNGTSFVVVEAKNWSSNVDRVEYDALHMKVSERGGSCHLGLFVAATGFSSGFYERASHHGAGHFSIVPVTVGWILRQLEKGISIESTLGARVESVVLDRQWEEEES